MLPTDKLIIEKLEADEAIPYDLLLLADEEMQAIDRYIHQSEIYIAKIEENVVGAYVLYPIDELTAEVKAIAVEEHRQNKGIGKMMLKHAEDVAREKNFKNLLIGTPTIAYKQQAIYLKAGFEAFAIKKDFFLTNYSKPIFEDGLQLKDMVVLRKHL